jgi:hypothetical protein
MVPLETTSSHSTVRIAANLMQQVYRNITKPIQFGNVRFVLAAVLEAIRAKLPQDRRPRSRRARRKFSAVAVGTISTAATLLSQPPADI